jgi:DNA-directed RNA polymerase specialized sigma24 family protein
MQTSEPAIATLPSQEFNTTLDDNSNVEPKQELEPMKFEPRKREFDRAFLELIKSPSINKRVDWLISQYQLRDYCAITEIFCDVYIRAIKSLKAGKEIKTPNSWIRATAHNVVRERFRSHRRQGKLENKVMLEVKVKHELNEVRGSCDDKDFSQIDELLSSMEQLNSIDRKILLLQAEGMSLENIASQLVQDGDLPHQKNLVANITQKASRARRKLREIIADHT